MLARELAAERAAYAIDRAPEDRAVGPREVHQLEDATLAGFRRQGRQLVDLGWRALNAQEFARLQLTHRGGADQIECAGLRDRKSTRLNSSHVRISYAVFC